MRSTRKRGIITALVLVLCLLLPCITTASAASERFEVSVKYGFDNSIRAGANVPFHITIKNNGGDFEGYVQVIVPSYKQNQMLEKDLSLAAGATKTIAISVPVLSRTSAACIRITNQKGKVLSSQTVQLKPTSNVGSINIGVLSDDFSALSYMSLIKMYQIDGTDVRTQLLELNTENFPEDITDFDLIDILLITNYSTDRLSDTQLSALNQWIRNGGALIVGTGSTISKTMSGLKNLQALKVFNTDSVKYETHKTTYGLSKVEPEYITPYDIFGSSHGHYYSELSSFGTEVFNRVTTGLYDAAKRIVAGLDNPTGVYIDGYDVALEYYNADSDFLWNTFGSYYGFYWDVTERTKYYTEFVSTVYKYAFQEYCDEAITKALYGAEVSQQDMNFSSVNAEITTFTLDAASKAISGDIIDGTGSYALARHYNYGAGTVLIAGVDFTQNPLASYESNEEVFHSIVRQSLDNYLTQLIIYYRNLGDNFSRSTGSPLYALYTPLSSAAAPPFLLYVIVLILYLVAIPVSYGILKKKRKNVLFWPTAAIMSLGFAFLIFLCSFTTKLRNAEFRTAKVAVLGSDGQEITLVSAFVTPSKKTYKATIDNGLNLDRNPLEIDSYYNNTQALDTFAFGMNRRLNDSTIIVNSEKALSAEYLEGTHFETEGTGTFSVKFDDVGRPTSVTNTTGYDITRAFVMNGMMIFLIGDIANGDTVAIPSTVPSVSYSGYYSYSSYTQIVKEYMSEDVSTGAGSFLFGLNSEVQRRAMLRLGFLSYCRDQSSTNHPALIGGFAEKDSSVKVQPNGGYREWNYTMVVQYLDYGEGSGYLLYD